MHKYNFNTVKLIYFVFIMYFSAFDCQTRWTRLRE